ncbi:hypothetical protein HQQ81_13895 [Microbacteriaceae bacterium VKM Ac-2854]|nr:hypothetical protein [Microbacteriaceae bacterium VKM Ac-2854]
MYNNDPIARELLREIEEKALRNLERQGVMRRDPETGEYIRIKPANAGQIEQEQLDRQYLEQQRRSA